MFTLSKCFIRSYHPASQTFLDLVDDQDSSNSQDSTWRLRLRAGCRKQLPAAAILEDPGASDLAQPHLIRAARMYESGARNDITFWPPAAGSPEARHVDPTLLAELYRVVKPPEHLGAVKGAWDERSLVYSTAGGPGRDGGMQALVFVSFDPSTRLPGLKEWGNECSRRDSGYESGHGDEDEDMAGLDHWAAGSAGEDSVRYDEAGKGKAKKQVAASPLPDMEDNESVASPPPQPDYYFPGWMPEASFEWLVEVTGGDNGVKGKGKAPADDAAACDVGDSGAGDLDGTKREGDAATDAGADADAMPMPAATVCDSFSTTGQAFSSFSSHYSAPTNINCAPGGSGGASSSQQPQPREAPPAATTPTKQHLWCKWASKGWPCGRKLGSDSIHCQTSQARGCSGEQIEPFSVGTDGQLDLMVIVTSGARW